MLIAINDEVKYIVIYIRTKMAWSVTELGADILLFEQLLDFALCNHIIQIAECCKFEAAGIEL